MIAGLMCLALTIYFEARGEDFQSQVAVGHVVMNRVKSPNFPNTICEVTTEGGEYRHRCQFSWYCDGLSDDPKEQLAWRQSIFVAAAVPLLPDKTKGALWYHADYVKPNWATTSYVTFGKHRFYNALQN